MLIRQAPASTAFKNAFLSRATEYEHVEQVVRVVQDDKEKKEELLMQMGIQGLAAQDVKIYANGGMKFSVSDKDLMQSLPQARHMNKDLLS